MDECTCVERTRLKYLMKRALRAVLGVIMVGVMTFYLTQLGRGEKENTVCQQMKEKLDELKAKCLPGRRPTQSDQMQKPVTATDEKQQFNSEEFQANIRRIIKAELELFASDRTGMADFAMENLGACVVTVRDTKPFIPTGNSFFGIDFLQEKPDPTQILRPLLLPGHCWAFKGNRGTVVIKLMSFASITHISIDHISPLLTPSGSISSAPKIISVWGLEDSDCEDGKHNFGTFEYKLGSSTVQTFPVQRVAKSSFRIVEVNFEDNHGNPDYTCVYRVRIHGKLDADKQSATHN